MLRRVLRTVGSAIGRRLPQPLHPWVQGLRLRLLVPGAGRLEADASSMTRVTVLGYLTAPTGLGEGARLCAASLAELGFTVGLIDTTPLHRVPGGVSSPEGAGLVRGDVGGPLICHLNPPEFETSLRLLGLSGERRKLIAYWAWELPFVPPAWRHTYRLVHEVWVPSPFVADALRASGFEKPIRVVAHPLRAPPAGSPPAVSPIAVATGCGGVALTVLTVFAYESGFNRKNPLAAIDAFRLAFGDRRDVRLIIKVRAASVSGAPERALAARVVGAENIEVRNEVLSHEGMVALTASADVILSLHRAEGFGIPLAAAMLMGKPVVATGWSGNLAFMDEQSACLVAATSVEASEENSPYAGLSARWAEPSLSEAAAWLRRLEDPALRREIGARARAHARARLGLIAFADAVAPAFSGEAQGLCSGATAKDAAERIPADGVPVGSSQFVAAP